MSEAGKRLSNLLGRARPKGYRWHGIVGNFDGVVDVPNKPGWKYVRIPKAGTGDYELGEFPELNVAGTVYNSPVLIEYDPLTGQRIIAGGDQQAAAAATPPGAGLPDPGAYSLPKHAPLHQVGGSDQVTVSPLQISNIQVSPSATAKHVTIGAGLCIAAGTLVVKTTDTDVDLTAYFPASGYKLVWVTLTSAGAAQVIDPLCTSFAALALPTTTNYVAALVKLQAFQPITWGSIVGVQHEWGGLVAWDVAGQGARHASDISAAAPTRHVPLGAATGDLIVWDGSKWVVLTKGSQYQVLTGGATTPTWGAVNLGQATAITGVLPAANGGTGISNAGTITNATATTITGGGTLALAGFTLTVPATGITALLATANVFTLDNTIHTLTIGLGSGNIATNTAVGYQALLGNSTGLENTAVGYQSLKANTTLPDNTAIGAYALLSSTGRDNTAIGANALVWATTADSNTAVGELAGAYVTGGVTKNQTSGFSVYLGYMAYAYANGDTNEIVIGSGAFGAGSNTATLGNVNVTTTVLRSQLKLMKGAGYMTADVVAATGLVTFNAVNEAAGVGSFTFTPAVTFTAALTANSTAYIAGHVGIGTAVDGTVIVFASETTTAVAGSRYAINSILSANPAASSAVTYYGYRGGVRSVAACAQNLTGQFRGIESNTAHLGSGTLTSLYGVYITIAADVGTVTSAYGLYIPAFAATNGGSFGTKYAIYTAGTEPSYFAGNVGIGTAAPTISDGVGLHIAGKILRIATAKTPASSGAAGNIGEICWDTSYIYVCTAANTWERAAIAAW